MSTGACVQNQIHIGSLGMPTSGTIWLGRIILFFIMLLLAGLGFLISNKQTNSLFYFSTLVESVVLIALKKTSRSKLISQGLLGACVALCFLGSLIFLTNWKWAL